MREQKSDRARPALPLGGTDIASVLIALAVLALAVFVFVWGITQFRASRLRAEPPLTPIPTTLAADAQALPADAPTPTPLLGPTQEAPAEEIQHTVQEGETLTSISLLYNVSLDALAGRNNLGSGGAIFSGQVLTIPLGAERAGIFHEVRFGETLTLIAQKYSVAPALIQAANNLRDANAIYAGQRLQIPDVEGQNTAGATPTLTPLLEAVETHIPFPAWPRTKLVNCATMITSPEAAAAELEANYPLSVDTERFTLYYQPGTYVDRELDAVVTLFNTALAYSEALLDVRMNRKFEVYAAGTLFEHPATSLRGASCSRVRKLTILIDGSGDEAENLYLVTHELAHIISWNEWGQPSSTMLSEGVATYAGRGALEAGGYLPYDDLCLAAYEAGRMPSMAIIENDWQVFQGHILYRFNYFGSACFVEYLVEAYGLETLARLYHTSDYQFLYGSSLASLDADWRATLEDRADVNGTLNLEDLTSYTDEVAKAYDFVFDNYNGTSMMHQAYVGVDLARLALWRGEYDQVRLWLDRVYDLTGYRP